MEPLLYERMLAPHRVPYATKDGYVCVLVYNDRQWRSFFKLVGREEMFDNDPRFSRDRAAATGYVPSSIVASPLLYGERALGVLSVLDRDQGRSFGLAELEVLSRFSTQAAIGLDLLLRARRARTALGDDESGTGPLVARVAALLDETDEEAGRRLLEALEELLR